MNRNFGGLVIDKNYKHEVEKLSALLEREFALEGAISFSNAIEPLTKDFCNILFTEQGTLILLNIDMADCQYSLAGQETFSFFIAGEEDTHFFNHLKNGSIIASEYVLNGVSPKPTAYQMITPQEEVGDISENVIYNTIKSLLGEDIREILDETPCYRYALKKKKSWWQVW